MAKHLRYAGEFLSRAGAVWRVEILQEASKAFAEVGELTFEADDPLILEWNRQEKHDAVCGSVATLKIESPGDRTYEDLYSIAPGRIRMDVYRDGQLYWSGTLDPEFYEEPYERGANYPVSLTFSDFGILDRLKYDLSGLKNIREILDHALEKSCILHRGIDCDTLTTTFFDDGATKAGLDSLSIRSDNFFDEEGEASTLTEVLDGLLRPLALRMTQRAGRIYVYDLNGLYRNTTGQRRIITWSGDSCTMGTDRVYNNARINFSPYSSSELPTGDTNFSDPFSTSQVNLTSSPKEDGEYYSYYPDYGEGHREGSYWDYALVNFTIFIGDGEGLPYINPKAKYFHILPMVGGPAECEGVAWGFHTGGHGALSSGYPKPKLNAAAKAADTVLMRTARVFIPKLSDGDRKDFYLRLTLDMLLDPRYNPFSEPADNEEANYNNIKEWTGWAFVPIAINLYDTDGAPLRHYVNKNITDYATHGSIAYSEGYWAPGAASFGDAWLEYYDPDDMENGTGILGWKANRHAIGRPDSVKRVNPDNATIKEFRIYDSFRQMADGQYIPYPPEGGFVEVTVYTGVNCYAYGEPIPTTQWSPAWLFTDIWDKKKLYDTIRWHLYKAPKLEIVRHNLVFDEAELDDVEYSGYLNEEAREEVSIDTICGTSDKTCPTARGVFFRTSDCMQLHKLHRAGMTDHPENLLIGTLYSQYADRKTTLEGECRLDPSGVTSYLEVNQSNKYFMLAGETQNAIADTSDALFIEFRPDEYEARK